MCQIAPGKSASAHTRSSLSIIFWGLETQDIENCRLKARAGRDFKGERSENLSKRLEILENFIGKVNFRKRVE